MLSITPYEVELVKAIQQTRSPEVALGHLVKQLATDCQTHCSIWLTGDRATPLPVQVLSTACLEDSQMAEPTDTPCPVYHGSLAQLPEWLMNYLSEPGDDAGETELRSSEAVGIVVVVRPDEHPDSELPPVVLHLHAMPLGAANSLSLSTDEVRSLQHLANSAYQTYKALTWHRKLRQARQWTALVGRVTQLLNSSLNPDDVVDRIVSELGQSIRCDRTLLVDFRHNSADLLVSWQRATDDAPALPALPDICRDRWESVLDMMEEGGASYLHLTYSADEDGSLNRWLSEAAAMSMVLIPITVREELFGAMALLSHASHQSYSVDQLQALRQVANQLAIALMHTQNYQGLQRDQQPNHPSPQFLRSPDGFQDDLTELMTRTCLDRELTHLSNRAMWLVRPAFSIIMGDIDYFKLVNDAHGHAVGDEVLRQIAERFQNQLRQGTPAYRYGGEEFVILLPETQLSAAIGVAERLRWAIAAHPIKTSVGTLGITVSFGVAQQDATRDRDALDVLERAIEAIAEAKRQGRDCVIGDTATSPSVR
jgi:diguanylate cyclase (GGDEF)-like protein